MPMECPLKIQGKCNRECERNPRYISYHPRPGTEEKLECYLKHMTLCSENFRKMYPKLRSSIERVVRKVVVYPLLPRQVIENIVGATLLAHDVGKLTIEYQEGKTWMRHELPGFYILLETGTINHLASGLSPEVVEALKKIFSTSIYIMHEPLLIKYERGWLRFPSAVDLLWNMRGWSYHFVEDYLMAVEATLTVFSLDNSLINFFRDVTKIDSEQLINAIIRVSTISYGPNSPSIRLAVASITKLIKDIDDEAARIGRMGMD